MQDYEKLQRAFARACGLCCADESPTVGFTGQSQPPSTIDTIAAGLPARPSIARAAVEGGQSSSAHEPAVAYARVRHVAHYHGDNVHYGRGHDLETWSYAQPRREPKPSAIPADAQWQLGYVQDGVQHWQYTRRAPLSGGTCERCAPAHPINLVVDTGTVPDAALIAKYDSWVHETALDLWRDARIVTADDGHALELALEAAMPSTCDEREYDDVCAALRSIVDARDGAD